MSDPTGVHTPAGHDEPPDTRLAERLHARRTHSLGVIDVRRAEAHYARIMEWLAARTPLLEHLRTRYGLTEDERQRGLNLAFAEAPAQADIVAAGEAGVFATTPERSVTQPAEQTFTYVAHVPDEPAPAASEVKRITRRGVPTFSPAGSRTTRAAGARAEGRDQAEPAHSQESRSRAQEGAGSPQDDPRGVPESADGGQPNAVRATPSAREIPAPSVSDAAQTLPPPLHSSSPPTTPPRAADEATRDRANAPGGEAPTTKELRDGETIARTDETIARAGEIRTRAGGREEPRAVGTTDARGLANPPLPLAGEVAARALPAEAASPGSNLRLRAGASGAQRAAVVPEEAPRDEAGRIEAVLASSEAARTSPGASLPLARAPELPAAAQPGVGATRLGAQTPLPLAAGPADAARAQQTTAPPQQHAAEQVIYGEAPPPAGGANFKGAARAGAGAPEVNVERLTEQVSRHLARRLLVERERRGLVKR